jgi:glycosyltransferase involved in cell wall biosynthesis
MDAEVMALSGARGSSKMRARRLRINWILPTPGLSGGIRAVRMLSEHLAQRGHGVTIACPRPGGVRPPLWPPRTFARWAARQRRLRGREKHHFEGSNLRLIEVAEASVRARDVPDADVTIATFWKTMEWIAQWPESKGLKAYFVQHYEVHVGDPERVRATYRQPSLKLVVSTWLKRLLAEDFGILGATVIPCGNDWSQFNSAPRGKADRPTVGFMYARTLWKGAETAIEAIRMVQAELPEVRILCFGAEPVARPHELPAGAEFHLRPSQAEIPKIYAQCDCWILPSTTEGFGLPGLEAAACRCPVVSTRCGGPEDYLRHGESGFFVDVGNPVQMATRVLDVLRMSDDRWRQMSEHAYRIAREFDWERSAGILEKTLLVATARASGR